VTDLILAPDIARELTWFNQDTELGLEVEAREHIEDRRWVSVHRLILKDRDGKFWATTYERGLTEMQDGQPFEYATEVEFVQVEKVPVTTYEYRRINA
jgi:hypothetical protein